MRRVAGPWPTLLVGSIGNIMAFVDASVVNVGMVPISRAFGVDLAQASFVVSGYSLAYAVAMVTMGTLTDRLGPRRAYLMGLLLFALASLGSAMAPTFWVLVGFRVLQGLAGALLVPSSLSLVVTRWSHRPALAATLWATGGALAVAIGPLVGGLLLQWGWPMIFLINVPLGAFALAFTVWRIEGPHGRTGDGAAGWDWGGTFLSASLMTLFLLTGMRIGSGIWNMGTQLMMAAVLGGGLLLVLWERRSRAPLMDVTLFVRGRFVGATLSAALAGWALMGALFLIPVWLQYRGGMSPLQSGFAVVAWALVVVPVAAVAQRITTRIPRRLVIQGGLLGMAASLYWIGSLSVGSPWLEPAMVVGGVGTGLALPLQIPAALAASPLEPGRLSALFLSIRQLGMTTGVSVMGGILHQDAGPMGFQFAFWLAAFAAFLAMLPALWVDREPQVVGVKGAPGIGRMVKR